MSKESADKSQQGHQKEKDQKSQADGKVRLSCGLRWTSLLLLMWQALPKTKIYSGRTGVE